jgi:hypothetical protein
MSAPLHDVSIEWSHAHFDATKRWQEAQEKHAAAQEAKLEAKLQARRAAKNAAVATSGPGWRVVDTPKVPHAELERLTHHAWDLAFHGIPFPASWRVRWGALRPTWRAATITSAKLIVLDERAQRGRTWREMLTTVLHELVHVTRPAEVHGAGFHETLRRVLAYVIPADGLADAEPVGAPRATARIQEGLTMDTNAPKATALDQSWEYAALSRDDGTPISRPAAMRSLEKFKQALQANGGHAPMGRDGQPMAWNESRGWFPRSTAPAPGGRRLADAMRQQIRVTQAIRFDERAHGEPVTDLSRRLHAQRRARLEQERADAARRDAAAIERYASASEDALAWMARYVAGWVGSPHPSVDECEGKLLAIAFPRGASLTAQCARKARLAR